APSSVYRVGSIRSAGTSSPRAAAATSAATWSRRAASTPAVQSWNRPAEGSSPYRETLSAVNDPSRSHANPAYAGKDGVAGYAPDGCWCVVMTSWLRCASSASVSVPRSPAADGGGALVIG